MKKDLESGEKQMVFKENGRRETEDSLEKQLLEGFCIKGRGNETAVAGGGRGILRQFLVVFIPTPLLVSVLG